MDNQTIRNQKRSWRDLVTADARACWEQQLIQVLKNSFFQDAFYERVLCFYPTASEVDLRPLYQTLLERGIALYFPVTYDHHIRFYRISSMDDFQEGRFHIMEPISMEELEHDEGTLALTPGLAFSKEGERIGYGGGFYDRFFAAHPDIIRVGICFGGQLSSEITGMDWDIPMHYVVTEQGVFTNL